MKKIILLLILLSNGVFLFAQIVGQVELTESDILISKNKNYDVASLKQSKYFTLEVGAPQLPVIIESFVIPLNAVVEKVEIDTISKQHISGVFSLLRTQPKYAIKETGILKADWEYDTFVNESTLPYPNKKIKINIFCF